MDATEVDRIIECPRCQIKNSVESDICYNCGASLHESPSKKFSWTWLPVVLFIFFGVGVIYLVTRPTTPDPPTLPLQEASAKPSTLTPPKNKLPVQPSPLNDVIDNEPETERINLLIGLVRIKDISGKLIVEISVPVVGSGWVALPTRVSLGGFQWMLQLSSGDTLEIEGGIINDQDQVSLWRIREDQNLEGLDLHPWSPDRPLTWLALKSQEPPRPVDLQTFSGRGNFIEGSTRGGLNDFGVFIQEGRVVGWTFGDLLNGVFLWNGDEGQNLKTEIRVADYYRLTFANSREEEFVLAFALGADYSDLDRLEAFTRAFRSDPKLSVGDTPPYLRADVVINQLRSLIARTVQDGFAVQAANFFDAEVLTQAEDFSLLSDVVLLTADSYGLKEAIDLTENVFEELQPKENREMYQLRKIYSDLYQNWLSDLHEGGDIQDAWRVFERGGQQLPDDLNVHLWGVKLALAENDWAAAEQLLLAKEYPPALKDQVNSLQAQISELKGLEGKIVIRFAPGTRQIPVTASLNQGPSQNFIVDTGATMVTIPYSTAEDLGISITERNPRRTVYTAGGVIYAPEVVLASINLEGFETNNVKALVMDLPNQPGMGLLGLNYLRRFQMNLNTEDGLLALTPK